MTSRDVVRDAGSASEVFFLRLGQLFNSVNVDGGKFDRSDATTQRLRRCSASLSTKPMPEDFQTRGLKFFESRQRTIDWKDPQLVTPDDLVKISKTAPPGF